MACSGLHCCGSSTVLTCCCPNAIPYNLHITLTGCYAGTYLLTYDPVSQNWAYGPDANGFSVGVFCTPFPGCQWELNASCNGSGGTTYHYYLNTPPTSVSCGPPIALSWGAGGTVISPQTPCCAGQITSATLGL